MRPRYHSLLTSTLGNSTFLLSLAIVAGFVVPQGSNTTKDYLNLIIIVILTVSTMNVSLRSVFSFKNKFRKVLACLIINYFVLAGLIIILAHVFFTTDIDLRNGFIIMATVPSAISIIPFTNLCRGDTELATSVITIMYLLTPVLTPLLMLIFLDFSGVNLWNLFILNIEIIAFPLFLSRILLMAGSNKVPQWIKDFIVNIAVFFLVYSVIGINQSVFASGQQFLFLVFLISLLRTFGSGLSVKFFAEKLGADRGTVIPLAMFASFKNMTLTTTFALTLFTARSSIPAAVSIPLEILFFFYLKIRQDMLKNH